MFRRKAAVSSGTFEEDFLAAARKLRIEVVSVDAEKAVVKSGAGETQLGFANVRPHWDKADAASRPAIVERFVTLMVKNTKDEKPKTLDAVRSMLVVRLGPPDFGPSEGPVRAGRWDIIPGHLSAYIVIDYPETVSYVVQHDLDTWGTTFEAIYPIALENLRKRTSPKKVVRPIKQLPTMKIYNAMDAFDAARALLLQDLLTPWPKYGAIFAVPTRDNLMFAPVEGMDTMKALDGMITITARFLENPSNPISDQVFWFDGKTFDVIGIKQENGKRGVYPPERFFLALMGKDSLP